MKLYHVKPGPGHPGSHNAVKVCIFMNEIGAPYEVIDCDPDLDLQSPASPLRKLNPNGLTPVIDDDGFILWESSAVLQYLATKHQADELYPQDPTRRAVLQQWLAWETSTLTPALMAGFMELSASGSIGEAAGARLDAALDILDRHLAAVEYAAGEYSIADIALGCSASALFLISWPLQTRTALLHWLGGLAARPAWQEDVFQNDIAAARNAGYAL